MIYTFRCESCLTEMDLSLTIDERSRPLLEPCPHCGQNGAVMRVFNHSGFHLGGSQTDVHLMAKKKGGSDWNHLLKRIKKGSARSNTMDI